MSQRRSKGDLVWLRAGAGFTSESNRLPVRLTDQQDFGSCMLDCGDEDCCEWDVITVPDYGTSNTGEEYPLYHVSECEMFDQKQPDMDPATQAAINAAMSMIDKPLLDHIAQGLNDKAKAGTLTRDDLESAVNAMTEGWRAEDERRRS